MSTLEVTGEELLKLAKDFEKNIFVEIDDGHLKESEEEEETEIYGHCILKSGNLEIRFDWQSSGLDDIEINTSDANEKYNFKILCHYEFNEFPTLLELLDKIDWQRKVREELKLIGVD